MLTAARQLGEPTRGYERPGHAVQRHCAAAIAALAGLDRLPEPGIDGCSLPNHPLPLPALARAAAGLADPSRRTASATGGPRADRGRDARPSQHGRRHGRCCTAVMEAAPA